jgi:uncharacterized membrane protein
MEPGSKDVQANKVMAILAYIIFFIPLLAAKDSPFAKYHANQGLVLFLIAVGANIVLGIIPIIGWVLLPLANIAVFVLAIIGIINAANGHKKPLPLIGGITLLK